MIDTSKYEGHTPAPWDKLSEYCPVGSIDKQLIADAPLLLERVIHLEHILKCAKDVLTNIYTYDKNLEDAEWIAWFCDMENNR